MIARRGPKSVGADKADAAFFDLAANGARDPQIAKEFKSLARAYRDLAKKARPDMIFKSRSERWAQRAEECRTLSDGVMSEECRSQLLRLANTYDVLADSQWV